MNTLTVPNHNAREGEPAHVSVEVCWQRRRGYARWALTALPTGRLLGWTTHTGNGTEPPWAVRISPSAFLGTNTTDQGDLLGLVPEDLYNGTGSDIRATTAVPTRGAAAHEIVCWLVRHRAPAVGFGPHPRVIVNSRSTPTS